MVSLTIVVPCYNEEAVLPETTDRLLTLLKELQGAGRITQDSFICYVDDGSSDGTWAFVEEMAVKSDMVRGLKLSRNRGHQNALLAGLLTVQGDVVVSIDADLQDDIEVIDQMLDHYCQGSQIVYGVREERPTDTLLKRCSAKVYYHLLKAMGVDMVMHHADFRLLGRPVLNALKEYGEVNIFLRGMIPTIGFPTAIVPYVRKHRLAGETRYTLTKMLALAIDGITSFSALPLRMISVLGLAIFLLSLLISAWALWVRFISQSAVPGWASSVLPMYLLGGVQLFSIGVLGEYVAKIYMETKRRPRFIIEKIL